MFKSDEIIETDFAEIKKTSPSDFQSQFFLSESTSRNNLNVSKKRVQNKLQLSLIRILIFNLNWLFVHQRLSLDSLIWCDVVKNLVKIQVIRREAQKPTSTQSKQCFILLKLLEISVEPQN